MEMTKINIKLYIDNQIDAQYKLYLIFIYWRLKLFV